MSAMTKGHIHLVHHPPISSSPIFPLPPTRGSVCAHRGPREPQPTPLYLAPLRKCHGVMFASLHSARE